jgi:Icc-related predicted phosphoesterase
VGRFRILFVSDLHGSEVCFRKFLNAVPVYHPDLLVYGGDLMGKILQPVFREPGDSLLWYPTEDRAARAPATELARIERTLADQGRYALLTDRDAWSELARRPDALEAKCRALGLERARAWLALADERLGPNGPQLVLNVGNDDTDALLDLLRREAPPSVLVPEGRIVAAGPYEIFGCGYANMTPWHCPRDLEEPELARVLDRTSSAIGSPRRTILDLHAPPFGTSIDPAKRPRTAAGELIVDHVGSPSIRALIERVAPVVSLHGHIHESKGVDRVGPTPVYNPGSVYFSGALQGLVLDLDGPEVVDHLFVTG